MSDDDNIHARIAAVRAELRRRHEDRGDLIVSVLTATFVALAMLRAGGWI
jgi:hypothetical protein